MYHKNTDAYAIPTWTSYQYVCNTNCDVVTTHQTYEHITNLVVHSQEIIDWLLLEIIKWHLLHFLVDVIESLTWVRAHCAVIREYRYDESSFISHQMIRQPCIHSCITSTLMTSSTPTHTSTVTSTTPSKRCTTKGRRERKEERAVNHHVRSQYSYNRQRLCWASMPLGKGKDGDSSLLGAERSADDDVCMYVCIYVCTYMYYCCFYWFHHACKWCIVFDLKVQSHVYWTYWHTIT